MRTGPLLPGGIQLELDGDLLELTGVSSNERLMRPGSRQ